MLLFTILTDPFHVAFPSVRVLTDTHQSCYPAPPVFPMHATKGAPLARPGSDRSPGYLSCPAFHLTRKKNLLFHIPILSPPPLSPPRLPHSTIELRTPTNSNRATLFPTCHGGCGTKPPPQLHRPPLHVSSISCGMSSAWSSRTSCGADSAVLATGR